MFEKNVEIDDYLDKKYTFILYSVTKKKIKRRSMGREKEGICKKKGEQKHDDVKTTVRKTHRKNGRTLILYCEGEQNHEE